MTNDANTGGLSADNISLLLRVGMGIGLVVMLGSWSFVSGAVGFVLTGVGLAVFGVSNWLYRIFKEEQRDADMGGTRRGDQGPGQ